MRIGTASTILHRPADALGQAASKALVLRGELQPCTPLPVGRMAIYTVGSIGIRAVCMGVALARLDLARASSYHTTVDAVGMEGLVKALELLILLGMAAQGGTDILASTATATARAGNDIAALLLLLLQKARAPARADDD